jgi:hypothetical protein
MRAALTTCVLVLAAGCGGPPPAGEGAAQAVSAAESPQPAAQSLQATPAANAVAAAPAFRGRTGELVNPDNTTMVLLYFDLAGLPPPIDQSLDDDMRVRMARATDKPAARDLVRKELEAGLAGVRNIGAIRMSLSANLSEYDATYNEFTVRALSPSSIVEFKALGQKVAVKFGNARTAQVWRVPAAEAQAVVDRVGFASDVSLDALLAIRDVHAAPEGGNITVNVVEYELRENRSGNLLGRVQLAP